MNQQTGAISLRRLIVVLLPVAVVAFGASYLLSSGLQQAQQDLESNILSRLLGPTAPGPDAPIEFVDANGDLVADAPAADACLAPEKLAFSYVASSDAGAMPEVWQPVVDALGEALGRPVEYVHYGTAREQLSALASGDLHVAGFNTGATPLAVRTSGFVPVCTFGREDGSFGYKMRILSPAGSEVGKLADLKDQRVTFVRPDSNSGCKAALVLLMDEYQLVPERDYRWSFSLGHSESIRGVASGQYTAAPVASDYFERLVAAGEVDPADVKVIYESELFPPAALGYAYNLAPDMREAIAKTLLEFDWSGTRIEGEFGAGGPTTFVPVNFKDDWANIRRVDKAIRKARQPNKS